MHRHHRKTSPALACESCGGLPHPRPLRLTLVKLGAVFPVEFVLHALVIRWHLPYAATVAVLAGTTTVLLIWVVEPSALRAARGWLHAPALGAQRRLLAAEALWRVRLTLDDEPGALEPLAAELARRGVNILTMHVHPLETGVRDELVVSAPATVQPEQLLAAAAAAGARDAQVWPTTALALADGQTKALSLAARVAADPTELSLAVTELLGPGALLDRAADSARPNSHGPYETELRLPTPWTGIFSVCRPDEPFTPAEVCRAHRLAEIAEIAAISAARSRPMPAGDSTTSWQAG